MSKIFIFFISLFFTFSAKAEIELYFSPSTDCEDHIIERIYQTKERLDVVIYSLTNEKIIDALIEAHQRGVQIRILVDRLQADRSPAWILRLRQNNINIKVSSKHKIEHNKMALFDNKVLFLGSYNWTMAATKFNSENCVFITNEDSTSEIAKKRIDYLWEVNSVLKSENWFKKPR